MISNKPSHTIKSVMVSFSSLCFSVSILRLCGFVVSNGSYRAGGLATGNFLLLLCLFEPVFMPVLLTKILLLYPSFFPMAQLKLLGSIYIPTPTKKSTFDNACSSTP